MKSTLGAVMLFVPAVAQIAYGGLAIGGVESLKDNVRDIESNANFGELYLSLTAWGVLLLVIGLAELGASLQMARGAPHSRLMGLAASLFGLAVAFFTMAIFHLAAVVTVVLLLMTLYVLSYRVQEPDDAS